MPRWSLRGSRSRGGERRGRWTPAMSQGSRAAGTGARVRPAIPPAYMPVSPSMRTVMPRWRSHSISLGTRAPAAGAFGLEMIPTVLMTGIEEKLLVPFGAGDGALDDGGLEPDFAHGPFHFFASRPVQC